MVSPLVTSATDRELEYIAGLDYGQDAQRHLDALRVVILEQQGKLQDGQRWFPYEVLELGSHGLVPGHEREIVICTTLVIEAVRSGFDTSTSLEDKFSDRSSVDPAFAKMRLRAGERIDFKNSLSGYASIRIRRKLMKRGRHSGCARKGNACSNETDPQGCFNCFQIE